MCRPSVIATAVSNSLKSSNSSAPPKSKRGRKKKLVTTTTSTSLPISPAASSRTKSKQILSQFILERKEKSIWQKYVRDMSDSIAERLGQQLRQSLKLKVLKKSAFNVCPTSFEEQRQAEMQRHHPNQQQNQGSLVLANLLALSRNIRQTASRSLHYSPTCGGSASLALPLLHQPTNMAPFFNPSAHSDRDILDQFATATKNHLAHLPHSLSYFSPLAAGLRFHSSCNSSIF